MRPKRGIPFHRELKVPRGEEIAVNFMSQRSLTRRSRFLRKTTVCLPTLIVLVVTAGCSGVEFSAIPKSVPQESSNGEPPAPAVEPPQESTPPHTPPSGPEVVYRDVKQSVRVTANDQVDILFVVDNSASMIEEQTGLSEKINGFMEKVRDLDWQIALTTTDPNPATLAADGTRKPWGDGQFRPFNSYGDQYILKSSELSPTEAQAKLAEAIQVGIYGGTNERGIYAVYRAIERSRTAVANQEFFRPQARLAVVLISDEDECSDGGSSGCTGGSASKSQPGNLTSFVSFTFGQEKILVFNAIAGPVDGSCLNAKAAGTYQAMASLTGGVFGPVCASDYTSLLQNIGQKVVDTVQSLLLQCQPVDRDGNGSPEIIVTLENGHVMSGGFSVQGSSLVFENPLPEGRHDIDYACLQ